MYWPLRQLLEIQTNTIFCSWNSLPLAERKKIISMITNQKWCWSIMRWVNWSVKDKEEWSIEIQKTQHPERAFFAWEEFSRKSKSLMLRKFQIKVDRTQRRVIQSGRIEAVEVLHDGCWKCLFFVRRPPAVTWLKCPVWHTRKKDSFTLDQK